MTAEQARRRASAVYCRLRAMAVAERLAVPAFSLDTASTLEIVCAAERLAIALDLAGRLNAVLAQPGGPPAPDHDAGAAVPGRPANGERSRDEHRQ